MTSPNQPRRFLGLQGKELIVVVVLVALLCSGLSAALLVASKVVSTISTALRVTATDTPEGTRPPPTATFVPPATLPPTSTPAPTPTPAPTSTPEPGQSRSNPLAPGAIVQAGNWEIQVVDFMRGPQAAQAIRAANQFNAPAPEGREYLAVKVRVKSHHRDGQSHQLSGGDFRVTGDRLVEYFVSGIVPPEPALDAELFAGGETTGWSVYSIGQGEGRLLLDFEPLEANDNQPVYIALEPDSAIPINPQLGQNQPTDRGLTREQPAQLGETLITDDWAVTVLEAIRGAQAWQMAQAANQFNDPPPAGREYLAVRARVRNLNPSDNTVRIDSASFKTIGDADVLYNAPSVVDPDPPLDAALYPGGEVEGWIILQIGESEKNAVLVFDPILDLKQQNRRFIALEK